MVLKLGLLGTFCLLVSLLILIAAPAAHAVCRSPKNICKHIGDCLLRTSERNNNDAVRIRERPSYMPIVFLCQSSSR
jgi:hypothetical protein